MLNCLILKYYWESQVTAIICYFQTSDFSLDVRVEIVIFKV
jgi:hypothetical protein